MDEPQYLLSYGTTGDFGRFESAHGLACRRHDRMVIRSQRGLEIGVVMRPATDGHCRLLTDRYVGKILRPAKDEDERLAEQMRERGRQLCEDARRQALALELPIEILDAEVLLDGRQAYVHYLAWSSSDPRSLMDALSDRHRLLVALHDLSLPGAREDDSEPAGCGAGNCNAGGGCGSCGTGGCGSCSAQAHSHSQRVALL